MATIPATNNNKSSSSNNQPTQVNNQYISTRNNINNNNSNTTTVTTFTTTSNISTNSLNTSLTINHNNNLNNSSSSSVTVTADAATVAIAKDMLQLHHGSALNNNNNNNNNNSNNDEFNSPANNNSNNNNNNCVGHMSNQRNTASTAAATTTTTTTSTLLINATPAQQQQQQQPPRPSAPPEHAVGYLKYNDDLLYITEACTVIGRNSSTSHVHFHVAENNLVSRKHFQVLFDADLRDFFVQCLSKNGIFVDDFLQRRNADPLKLPASCYFRFPSTEIRIQFESFLHMDSPANNGHHHLGVGNTMHTMVGTGAGGNISGNIHHVIISPSPSDEQQLHAGHQQHLHQQSDAGSHMLTIDNSNVIYSPLKISIPKKEQKSPYLSPTGTISAANSCPASPRQGFHQSQSNYNNYNSNNLQNQQDLFQTPSTASYNHNEKPPYSYAQLIVQAISAAPDKQLTLSGIYSFIVKHYPYYRKETNKGWQNSIRHNLSLNRYFIKVARSQDEPGKGSFWRIDPDSGAKLIDHSYKKRRQRSSQGFRPSYGMPRSAPVSPSHMEYSADNSRESSPLQDIILQSAPGSPGISLENRNNDSEVIYQHQQQQAAGSNNMHQYNNSTYYVTQQQTENDVGNNSGVGALIALKRNHALTSGGGGGMVNQQQQQQHQQQQLQGLHPDIIYEEMPADYSGNIEENDECDVAKRPKYISEML